MPSYVLRPVREGDLASLQDLAALTAGGLTNLPNDRDALDARIVESLRSFDTRVRKPGTEYYLFVLEDVEHHAVVGTSAILARVGGFEPFYSYEVRRERMTHPPLGIEHEFEVLHLSRRHKGPSELCSLFLRAEHRSYGLGRLLSLGRFHFIASFPTRFDEVIIAELRGYQDSAGSSPFWECVGRHFFARDYDSADLLSGSGNKDFIEDLMPKHPIYVALLPHEARAVIGRVHRDTEPALRLLIEEGFARAGEVDIFDAGPVLRAKVSELRSVQSCDTALVREILPRSSAVSSSGEAEVRIVSNRSLAFRATLGAVCVNDDHTVSIPREVATALEVEPGSVVCHTPMRSSSHLQGGAR